MLKNITEFTQWIKLCFCLSPYVTITILSVLFLILFGLARVVYLYGFSVFKMLITFIIGGRWFTDKSNEIIKDEKVVSDGQGSLDRRKVLGNSNSDSNSDSNYGNKPGGDVPLEEQGSLKVDDFGILKDLIKEWVKEGIKEALKDFVVKEAKKKKEKVIKTEGTSPKKGKKALTVGEREAVSPKKKKKNSSKGELVSKDVIIKE